MKYIRQFMIIILISFVGEVLHYLLPLPISASIYGLVLMLVGLASGLIPLAAVKDTAYFLVETMPLMFIPAAVGLLESWPVLKPMCGPIVAITALSTVTVMAAAGLSTQHVIRRAQKKEGAARTVPGAVPVISEKKQRGRSAKHMHSLLEQSVFFGVAVSIAAYEAGSLLKKKYHSALFNPLLLSVAATIVLLILFRIDYDTYYEGAKYLSYLLTPATVCLAVPMYEQLELLKKNLKAVMVGILSGVLMSLGCILVMAIVFGLNHETYVTLLPKSITTAIGMGVSEELGGYVTITVATIVITGVLGNIIGEGLCKLFHIEEPIAKGVALGTASHAIGTARAMEMGEIEGAMASLSIAVAGLLTVVGALVFSYFW